MKPAFSLARLSVVAVCAMVFVMGLVKIYSPDLGFHLQSAKWIIEHKAFIYIDSFSAGSNGHRYYDLQWIFQLVVFALYNKSQTLLIIVNSALITLSVYLTWIRFQKFAIGIKPAIAAGLFGFITFLFVQPLSFEIRPHVFSWIYLNVLLLLLESYKRGNRKDLYFIPFIMLLWVNTHSLSILGLVTLAIYNTGSFFEKKKVDRLLLQFSVFSFLAFLINPYFFEGLIFPLKQFGLISGNGLFKSYIGEMQSPFTAGEIRSLGTDYFKSPLMLLHLSAVVSFFAIFFSLKRKNYTDLLLLVAYLFLLNLGHKNFGYYFMVCLPLVVKYMILFLYRFRPAKDKTKIRDKENQFLIADETRVEKKIKRLATVTMLLTILISITSFNDGYQVFRKSPYRFGFGEDASQLPVEASRFLSRNNISGKILNQLNFGGYLMCHNNGQVFIDGRIELMADDFFEDYYNSVTKRNGVQVLLDSYQPDVVVFPYLKATAWWDYFITHRNTSGYKPVYFDGLSVIYLKTALFSSVPELTESSILKDIDTSSLARLRDILNQPAKAGSICALAKSLWQRQVLSTENDNKATFCFTNGFGKAGVVYSLRGIEMATVHTPNIFKNLSIYFNDNKLYNEARLCEEKAQ